MTTRLTIQEERGKYYAEVHTLNGCNIAFGNTIMEAYQLWQYNQSKWFNNITEVKLTTFTETVILPINEFLENYHGK